MHTPHNNNHAECRDEMHGSRTRCFDQALVCPSSDPRTSQSIHCLNISLCQSVPHSRSLTHIIADCAHNLAIAHLRGIGGATRDPQLALAWLREGGTARSLRIAASIEATAGRTAEAARLRARVARLEPAANRSTDNAVQATRRAPTSRSTAGDVRATVNVNDGHFRYFLEQEDR